ncbi:MAG: hypothetical protein ACPGKG_04720 [Paracoccaceae bacterium]
MPRRFSIDQIIPKEFFHSNYGWGSSSAALHVDRADGNLIY